MCMTYDEKRGYDRFVNRRGERSCSQFLEERYLEQVILFTSTILFTLITKHKRTGRLNKVIFIRR